MWNLSKLLSALWGLLGVLVVLILFIVYANFPEHGSLDFFNTGKEIQLGRQLFFSFFAGAFLIVNLVIFLSIRMAAVLKKTFKETPTPGHLKVLVAVKTLACGANLFLCTLMIFLRSAMESQGITGSWRWMILLAGPLVMISGLLYLLYSRLNPLMNDK